MAKLLDLHFDHFMAQFGFIVGAGLLCVALAGFTASYWFRRPPPAILAALAAALVLGGLLFAPAAPRAAGALWRLATLPPPPAPAGPLPVQTANVSLPPAGGEGAAIEIRIWYPSAAASGGDSKAPVACAGLTELGVADLSPADLSPKERYPVLLYAPGVNGPRDDNASSAASLASDGFVVVAIDDIDYGRQPGPEEPPLFDFSSEAAYQATLVRAADKAAREARQALLALDRLSACVAGDWRRRVQFDRVGFFGFSYGGGVAATAGLLDPRVAAVANLDGWVYGPALSGSIKKPYLLLFEDFPGPGPHSLQSPDPGRRYSADLDERFMAEQKRLIETPDKYGFRFRNSSHRCFTDWVFSREALKEWLFVDPARMRTIKDSYLAAFFSAYLRGGPKDLLTQTRSPYREVDVLKGRPHWSDGEERVPVSIWFGFE